MLLPATGWSAPQPVASFCSGEYTMALDTSESISLYEILETPYDGSVDQMYGEFALSALERVADNDSHKVQIKIANRLANLNEAEENVLQNYIARWQQIGTNTATLDGSVGNVNGATYSPDHELMRIQQKVKILIPIMHYQHEMILGLERNKRATMNLNTYR